MESKRMPATSGLFVRFLSTLSCYRRKKDGMVWKPETVVDRIAGDLMGEMEVDWLERTPQKLAHIACWYKQLVQHRGYLLFVSQSGWAVFMAPDYQYLQGSGSRLVQIKGIAQARTFLDALLTAQKLLAN